MNIIFDINTVINNNYIMETSDLLQQLFGNDADDIQAYIELDNMRTEYVTDINTNTKSKIMAKRLEDLIKKKNNKNHKRNTRNSKKTEATVNKLSNIKQICGWEEHLI